MLGHVTSSYPSAALERTFALALLKGGRDRIGSNLYVVVDDVPQPVTVTGPVVVDPDGLRRDGDPAGDGDPIPAAVPAHSLPVSPLAAFSEPFAALSRSADAGVRIAESPLTSQVLLRVTRGSAAEPLVTAALGTELPALTGGVTYAGSDAVLALGPDEFLVLAGPGHSEELESRLRSALDDEPGAVTDVSASRTLLRISGRNARRVLAHGLAIDLGRLPEGSCAQTLLAQCAVVVLSDGDPWTDDDLLKVLVRSSFAAHLAHWLLLTAPEYV